MKRKVITLLMLACGVTIAQNFDKKALDNYFNNLESKHKVMGDVAIYKDGKIIYNNPIGFADPANLKENNKDTKFRIGSISKTFTATLVLKAQEEGLLNMKDSLAKFYPSLPNASKINIANLLDHTSGLSDYTNNNKYRSLFYKEQTEQELIDILIKEGSNYNPNEKFEYSNVNYILLSLILEKVYNKSYANLLQQKITIPLGLKNTFYGGKINANNNEAHSFKYVETWLKQPQTHKSVAKGAGAIVSNVQDLITFINGLFSQKIINDESLSLMKPLQKNYGFGLANFPINKKSTYGHNGKIDGFKSNLLIIPDDNITICTLFNATSIDDNPIILNLYRAATNKPLVPFEKKNTLAKINDVNQYLGVYENEVFPLDITITTDGKNIFAQATGQSKFKLDAYPKDVFQFDQAGIKMKFLPKEGMMLFLQGTTRLEYKKKVKSSK